MTDVVIAPEILQDFTAKSATKAIYLVVADCSDSDKDGPRYYLSSKVDRGAAIVGIKGIQLDKAQAKNLGKTGLKVESEMEIEIPWQRIRRIENLTYKPKVQGEKK